MPKPFYQDDWVTLYHGDALAILAGLPDASVDGIITDPPYSSGGATQTARKASTGTKYEATDRLTKTPDFVGDSRECLRIAKPGALFMAFTDWRQYAATADALQAGGWTWRGTLTWVKPPHTARPQKGRFSQPCEYVLWGTKGAREIDPHGDAATPQGWYEAIAPRGAARVHTTEKPVDPASVILDPFAGSGTTGVAAKSEGHRFVGIEATAHYCEIAARRLAQDVLDFGVAS